MEFQNLLSVSLNDLVPQDNFYRKLNQKLDLKYLYKVAAQYYRREGQVSIETRRPPFSIL
jgi:hypothetical protein